MASSVPSDIDTCTICDPQPDDANTESKEIPKPSSYLVFDTETTGLPGTYGNPRITELCLLGVHREDMMEDGVGIPRVVNKLQLCLNPKKRVTPGSSMITGLFNDALERQQPFGHDIIAIIRGFIQTQAQPTCLVAHNGIKFDFPLLVSELMKAEEELPQDLLCADSLLAFRELDADPACRDSPVVVREQTWEKTEITPVKRASPTRDHESGLPKKPRKDLRCESLFENIERAKVAKKLQYTDQNENIKSEDQDENSKSSSLKSNSVPQTDVQLETAQGQSLTENNPQQMSDGLLNHHSSVGCSFQTECDIQTESRRHNLAPIVSPCSQGSLLDDDLLMAVTQIESVNNLSGLKQNESGACADWPLSSSKSLSDRTPGTVASSAITASPKPVMATTENVTASPTNVTASVDVVNALPETATVSVQNAIVSSGGGSETATVSVPNAIVSSAGVSETATVSVPIEIVSSEGVSETATVSVPIAIVSSEGVSETATVSVQNAIVSSEGVSAAPETVTASPMHVTESPQTVTASPQTVTEMPQIVTESTGDSSDSPSTSGITASTVAASSGTSTGTCGPSIAGTAAEISSVEAGVRPGLTSEATVIYTCKPGDKAKQSTSTELNSQGSLPDCDFLEAVQNMEMLQERKTTSDVVQSVDLTGIEHNQTDKVKATDSNTNNSSRHDQTVCKTRRSNTESGSGSDNSKSNIRQNVVNGSDLLPAKSETPVKQTQTPNGGKRRSFRLPDLYRRHFGHPPTASHTAEDDCISLLKVMKKFSPRFLDWVDENCVLFRTVKPMY